MENKYIFFRNDQKKDFFEFNPLDPECLDKADYKYFGRVLNLAEPMIRGRGLTIYVTAWTVHELPSYGPNVISCILQDEWSREPKYRDKVGMVFRTCAKNPITLEAYKHGGLHDMFSNFLGQGKALTKGVIGRIITPLSALTGKKIAPVYSIPLGYYPCEDISYTPINERGNDLYFAGSVKHISKRTVIIKRPKELARNRMCQALIDINKNHPNINVKSSVTKGFGESIATDNETYLNNMMNTKICPIPRGANLETFRFYEAIRYGCIPIGESFPNDYFYNDAPIIRLKNWSCLEGAVIDLLKDKEQLQYLHQKSLDWWNNVCSEKATAEFMCDKIKSHFL